VRESRQLKQQTREEMMGEYELFIKSKQSADVPTGFDCDVQIGPLFDFQAACVKWALKRGRAARHNRTNKTIYSRRHK
jgi:hypothetical protein